MFGFEYICGNEKLISHLQVTLKTGRIPHASIFAGQSGLGKKLVANSFAKSILCETDERASGCCCSSCTAFDGGNHPDVIYVKAAGKTKAIGVNDVRAQMAAHMHVRPYRAHYKIFIVDHADTLSVAAQNALLKTIEEPTSFAIFMLLCENHYMLLPTVLSRCVLFKLSPVSAEQAGRLLRSRVNASDAWQRVCVDYAQGNIGRALALCQDEDFTMLRDQTMALAFAMCQHTSEGLFTYAKMFDQFKNRIQEMLDILYMTHRDIAVLKGTGDERFIIQKDKKKELMAAAQMTTLAAVLKKCGAIALAKRQLTQNGNFQLVIQILLLSLAGHKGDDAKRGEIS